MEVLMLLIFGLLCSGLGYGMVTQVELKSRSGSQNGEYSE